jgi:hypothetical protein
MSEESKNLPQTIIINHHQSHQNHWLMRGNLDVNSVLVSPHVRAMSSLFIVSNVECLDLAKSPHGISTGCGYLDHMLDQFNSHAQVGVAISVATNGDDASCDVDNRNRFASHAQKDLQASVGAALGTQLKSLLTRVPDGATSRFCCPLDEALVECVVTKPSDGNGSLDEFTLAPYGIYP